MLRDDRHLHFGLHADPAAFGAARLPDLHAAAVRASIDDRPPQHAHRPAVAARTRLPITSS